MPIYSEIIWLPNYGSISRSSFAIVTHYTRMNETVKRIKATADAAVVRTRHKIASLHDDSFSLAALFKQVGRLLNCGFSESDLRCAEFDFVRG